MLKYLLFQLTTPRQSQKTNQELSKFIATTVKNTLDNQKEEQKEDLNNRYPTLNIIDLTVQLSLTIVLTHRP